MKWEFRLLQTKQHLFQSDWGTGSFNTKFLQDGIKWAYWEFSTQIQRSLGLLKIFALVFILPHCFMFKMWRRLCCYCGCYLVTSWWEQTNCKQLYFILASIFDHCLPSRNDGGSPHKDGRFTFVAGTGMEGDKKQRMGLNRMEKNNREI